MDAENDRKRLNDLEDRVDRLNVELEASRAPPPSPSYASRNGRENVVFSKTSNNKVTEACPPRKTGRPKGVTINGLPNGRSVVDGQVSLPAVSDRLDVNALGTNDVWSALQRAGLIINLEECSPNWSDDPLPILMNMIANVRKTNVADDTGIVLAGGLSDATVILRDSSDFTSDHVAIGLMRSPPADLRAKASAAETKDRCRDDDDPEVDDYLRFLLQSVWAERSFSEWFASDSPDDVDGSERSAITSEESSIDEVYDSRSSRAEPLDDDVDESGTDDELYVERSEELGHR